MLHSGSEKVAHVRDHAIVVGHDHHEIDIADISCCGSLHLTHVMLSEMQTVTYFYFGHCSSEFSDKHHVNISHVD